jgi:hypothetical protein
MCSTAPATPNYRRAMEQIEPKEASGRFVGSGALFDLAAIPGARP